ncbi:MAG TPA: Sir2 family NAD-dependent protein deacetylase [Paraburkholderia sp.]|jgi:NAD-dependent SIR2 family protein deacetylase|uniref:SIR2 family NAD-dependent protein deacylase n=1 Tax=Paraburkholderia sp. TaxID=1926495 RepID=UPI002DEAAFE0|nr:Sir2 family NAD-dependent protein deacetylase [Paraburkholderia sp.]
MDTTALQHAAQLIDNADALIIAAGAGMSVDSGLPDFRGSRGLWTTLLPEGLHERDLHAWTQGRCFETDPTQAWRFYGEALRVCESTVPHAGHAFLLDWADRKPHGAFVYTSNVDGHFEAAGFAPARIVECHGSIRHFQCARPCSPDIWPAAHGDGAPTLPRCRRCGALARPNFLLFSDPAWVVARTNAQRLRMETWRAGPCKPVVIEIGAGLALPGVRMFAQSLRLPLIRINTDATELYGAATIALQGRALDVLTRIDAALARVHAQ